CHMAAIREFIVPKTCKYKKTTPICRRSTAYSVTSRQAIQLTLTGAHDLISALSGPRCLHLPSAENRSQWLLSSIRSCALPAGAEPRRWQPEKGGSGFFRQPGA